MKLWEELEQRPEYGLLTPEDKVAVHDEWRSSILGSLADEDPEAVDPVGVNRFVATERARSQALKTGKTFDPVTAEKDYLREVTDRTAAQKQAMKDYDELERAKFALRDAESAKNSAVYQDTFAGEGAKILNETIASKKQGIAQIESRFTPEMLRQVKEAREAEKGERPTAVLGSDLYTDPSLLLDKDRYRAAVAESGASPEAKAKAMAGFATKRKQFAEEALRTLRVAGESPIPGAQDFPTWEASQPEDVRRLAPEDKVLQYMREMEKRGDIRKLTSAIGTGLMQGGTDIASQGLGVAAMVANSAKLAERAAEVAEGAQTLEEVSKLEGDKQATGATTLGGAARLLPPMAATIAPAALTGGASLGVSAALAGAQTAGAQFPTTYTELRKQGMPEQDALNAARNSAIASGIVTAGLTAAFGKTGVEAALGAGAGGKELVKSRLVAAMKAVPKGAIAEIPEELLDEMASQVIEQRTIDPTKPVSQIIDEFAETAPDLAMQIALLGGAGGAVGGYRGSTTKPKAEEFPAAGEPPPLKPQDYENRAAGGQPVFDETGNVIGVAPPGATPEETTAYREDSIRKAAEEATKQGIPVEVEGVTIATIPPGSDMTPDEVRDLANSPEDMAKLAAEGKIVLPEVVAPIEGVDPAITGEMNERVAASAALAPQTVEALKAAPAPEVQTETAEPVREEGAEAAEAPVTETPEEVKPAETLGVTPPPAPPLEAPEGAARNADMLRQAAARAAGTEQGPRIGFLQPSPAVTPETETPSSTANAAGGSQSVQTEPAEGSIPAVTEDIVSTSDIPSTPEKQAYAPDQLSVTESVREEPAQGTPSRKAEEAGARDSVLRAAEERAPQEIVTPQGAVPTPATEGKVMPGGSAKAGAKPRFPAEYVSKVRPIATNRISQDSGVKEKYESALGIPLTDDQAADIAVEIMQQGKERGEMILIGDALSTTLPDWPIEAAWEAIKPTAPPTQQQIAKNESPQTPKAAVVDVAPVRASEANAGKIDNSKVHPSLIAADGTRKQLYHGKAGEFADEELKIHPNTMTTLSGLGPAWFTTNKAQAHRFSVPKGNIMAPDMVALKRPLIIEANEDSIEREKYLRGLLQIVGSGRGFDLTGIANTNRYKWTPEQQKQWSEWYPQIIKFLESEGVKKLKNGDKLSKYEWAEVYPLVVEFRKRLDTAMRDNDHPDADPFKKLQRLEKEARVTLRAAGNPRADKMPAGEAIRLALQIEGYDGVVLLNTMSDTAENELGEEFQPSDWVIPFTPQQVISKTRPEQQPAAEPEVTIKDLDANGKFTTAKSMPLSEAESRLTSHKEMLQALINCMRKA